MEGKRGEGVEMERKQIEKREGDEGWRRREGADISTHTNRQNRIQHTLSIAHRASAWCAAVARVAPGSTGNHFL